MYSFICDHAISIGFRLWYEEADIKSVKLYLVAIASILNILYVEFIFCFFNFFNKFYFQITLIRRQFFALQSINKRSFIWVSSPLLHYGRKHIEPVCNYQRTIFNKFNLYQLFWYFDKPQKLFSSSWILWYSFMECLTLWFLRTDSIPLADPPGGGVWRKSLCNC